MRCERESPIDRVAELMEKTPLANEKMIAA